MKKLLSLTATLLAAALLLPTGCATYRADGNTALMKRFRQADKNNDRRVTRDEFVNLMIEEAFVRYDKNGDGFITVAEYTALGGSPKGYRSMDRGRSGKVSLADAKASKIIRNQMAQPFDEANAATGNKGWVSFKEFTAFRDEIDSVVR